MNQLWWIPAFVGGLCFLAVHFGLGSDARKFVAGVLARRSRRNDYSNLSDAL